MEKKFDFVRDGVTKLPPGFRFQPTEEEIVFQYLARKIFHCSLPASIIPEINVFNHDPWELPGDTEQDRYFFSNKEAKYKNGSRTNRATVSGYWTATGSDKKIICNYPNKTMPIMGIKKTLVFHQGKPSNSLKTDWIMHEYRLVLSNSTAHNIHRQSNLSQGSLVQIGSYVVCHIFLNKKNMASSSSDEEDFENNNDDVVMEPRFYEFMMEKVDDNICDSTSILTQLSSSAMEDSDDEICSRN